MKCDAVDRRVLETQRTSVAADRDITLGHWRIYPYYLFQTAWTLESQTDKGLFLSCCFLELPSRRLGEC
jgi:hypothetical protein